MTTFTGRQTDLARLDALRQTVARAGSSRSSVTRSGLAYVIFQATKGRHPAAERADFTNALGESSLPGGELVAGLR